MFDWCQLQIALAKAMEETLHRYDRRNDPQVTLQFFSSTLRSELEQARLCASITVSFQVYGKSGARPMEQIRGIPLSEWKYIAKMLFRANYQYQAYRDDTRELLGCSKNARHDGRFLLYGSSTIKVSKDGNI